MDNIKVERIFYDRRVLYTNCTVEVLEDTESGECSVGWYRTDETEEIVNE